MKPNDINISRPNVLLIISDEHNPKFTGCYGADYMKTPNLDSLASAGIRFENAYCNSPMCVPSRMSFLSGRYSFDIGVWDNGSPLRREIPSFAHYLEASGYETVLCGRMHMIGNDRTHGFRRRLYDDKEHWITGYQTPHREPNCEQRRNNSHVSEYGEGNGSHFEYDSMVADLAGRYLREKARRAETGRHDKIYPSNEPWMMTVGFTYPHFPHIIPERYASLYDATTLPLSSTRDQPVEDQHPAIRELRRAFCNLDTVPDEIQRESLRCHLGSVSFIDEKIGELLAHIDGSPLKENTVVIYTSDHGEMAGAHGIWQKQCFYEDSIRIPLLIRLPVGRDSKPGKTVQTPVSLVDVAPTLLTLAGTPVPPNMPGTSLLISDSSDRDDRTVFSEYHAQGSLSGYYMIKQGNLKYNYYVDGKPELFDLASDPKELRNLCGESAYAEEEAGLHQELLRTVGDPEKVDRVAKKDQTARLSAIGV